MLIGHESHLFVDQLSQARDIDLDHHRADEYSVLPYGRRMEDSRRLAGAPNGELAAPAIPASQAKVFPIRVVGSGSRRLSRKTDRGDAIARRIDHPDLIDIEIRQNAVQAPHQRRQARVGLQCAAKVCVGQ